MRSNIKEFKESHTGQNKPGRGRKQRISKTLPSHLQSPSQEWAARLQTSRQLQVRLKDVKDNLEKDYVYWKHVLWSDETQLKLFGDRHIAYVWKKKG